MPSFNPTFDIESQLYPETIFFEHFFAEQHLSTRAFDWNTADPTPTEVPGAEVLSQQIATTGLVSAALRMEGVLCFLMVEPDGRVFVRIAADETRCRSIVDSLKAVYPVNEPEPLSITLHIEFWWATSHGMVSRTKLLEMHEWKTIAPNYEASTRSEFNTLVAGIDLETEGRLILWHGIPGTGKSRALRALAWEWREWCDMKIVADPENVLSSAGLLVDMITQQTSRDRWQLLVLEDTGELLAADAWTQTGQALSRLLNVTDGLIGELSNTAILVTTNEKIDVLHPAVSRSGRCAARISFERFSEAGARAWLAEKDVTVAEGCPVPTVLADMYAETRGTARHQPTDRIGFAPPARNDGHSGALSRRSFKHSFEKGKSMTSTSTDSLEHAMTAPLQRWRGSHLHLTSNLTDTVFDRLALAKNLDYVFEESWSIEAPEMDGIEAALDLNLRWWHESRGSVTTILEGDSILLQLAISPDFIEMRGLCEPEERADLESAVRTLFPEKEPQDEIEVRFWFWDSCHNSPSKKVRFLQAEDWDGVKGNYSRQVRSELDNIMTLDEPMPGGQLMLWHGDPGTGKTHAIKALGRRWADWCAIEYITDPERFFGSASYLIPTMLAEPVRDQRWRLLVLEDTGELMRPDARTEMGQGLSRLLNVVDGLLGQGLRTLLLVTTNEPLSRLHPAVARPGRCSSLIEFEPFDELEARHWLAHRGVEAPASEVPRHLSDLFALKESFAHVRRPSGKALGFSA